MPVTICSRITRQNGEAVQQVFIARGGIAYRVEQEDDEARRQDARNKLQRKINDVRRRGRHIVGHIHHGVVVAPVLHVGEDLLNVALRQARAQQPRRQQADEYRHREVYQPHADGRGL